jgi:hypothetical protein
MAALEIFVQATVRLRERISGKDAGTGVVIVKVPTNQIAEHRSLNPEQTKSASDDSLAEYLAGDAAQHAISKRTDIGGIWEVAEISALPSQLKDLENTTPDFQDKGVLAWVVRSSWT